MLEGNDFTAFLVFLDKIKDRGEINLTTAQARKTACEAVIKMVGDEEPHTVEWVRDQLDDLMRRLVNKNSRLTSASAKTYKSRVSSAILDFLAYQRDPLGWRPKANRTSRAEAKKSKEETASTKGDNTQHGQKERGFLDGADGSGSMHYRFPLRPSHTIEIRNLPHDLKLEEAWRLACFVATLAQDFRPTGSSPFGEMVVAKG